MLKRWQTATGVAVLFFISMSIIADAMCVYSSYLLFDHIGPEDASGPPFEISVGSTEESSYQQIFVDEQTFKKIKNILRASSGDQERTPRPVGTFDVTEFNENTKKTSYLVYPETMITIIDMVKRFFAGTGNNLPSTLEKYQMLLSH